MKTWLATLLLIVAVLGAWCCIGCCVAQCEDRMPAIAWRPSVNADVALSNLDACSRHLNSPSCGVWLPFRCRHADGSPSIPRVRRLCAIDSRIAVSQIGMDEALWYYADWDEDDWMNNKRRGLRSIFDSLENSAAYKVVMPDGDYHRNEYIVAGKTADGQWLGLRSIPDPERTR